MIVRAEQIAAMQDAADQRWERNVAKQLAADQPELASEKTPEQMQEFVHRTVVRGRRHGISSSSDLGEFCGILFGMGGASAEANEPRWVRRILTNPKLDGSAKVIEIRAQAAQTPAAGSA